MLSQLVFHALKAEGSLLRGNLAYQLILSPAFAGGEQQRNRGGDRFYIFGGVGLVLDPALACSRLNNLGDSPGSRSAAAFFCCGRRSFADAKFDINYGTWRD
jgi:hypothetical protein